MELNHFLIFFIFGLSLLPKIYSESYPSLFLMKKESPGYMSYVPADKFEFSGDLQKVVKFFASSEYTVYNACPEENALVHPMYTLQVQRLVTDFEATPLAQFIKGFFPKYDCPNPISPTVLKHGDSDTDKFPPQRERYDIGFLVHETDARFLEYWKVFEDLPKTREYGFINFLTVILNNRLGTVISVRHRIINGKLLQPDSASVPLWFSSTNSDVYGFDVNSLYTHENQKDRFSLTFGDFYFRYYNYPDRRLIKVQLAPQEDFLLDTWKLPTLMDLNTTAMWIQVYPQWKKVESFVREIARELGELSVETGTAKVLELIKPVYLRNEDKSPLSKYVWKVVQFNQLHDGVSDTHAILIVMHNDPYTANQKPICDDIGKYIGWMVSNDNHNTGLTYVCPVNEKITTQLYDDFKVNYKTMNLKKLSVLRWVEEDITSKILSRRLADLDNFD